MSSKIHYIIDGSNLLHYSGLTEDYGGDVIAAREELNRLLGRIIGEKDSKGGVVSRVTVVYDIHSDFGMLKEKVFGVEVIYAVGKKSEQPADKEILLLLEKITKGSSSLSESICLVSDDNSLRREVIYFGCSPLRCEEFWQMFGMDYR